MHRASTSCGSPLLASKQGEYLIQSTLWNSVKSQPHPFERDSGFLLSGVVTVSLWTSFSPSLKPLSGVNPAGVNGSKLLSISGQVAGASGPISQSVLAGACETCRGFSILSWSAACVFTVYVSIDFQPSR